MLWKLFTVLFVLCKVSVSYARIGDEGDIRDNFIGNEPKIEKFPFYMPNVSPSKQDLYLCTPIKIDYLTSYYIVAYEPKATMNTTHHMLIYGCSEPGSTENVWNCGEMAVKSAEHTFSPCGSHGHSEILYAWARDAPDLRLPEGVGFKIGRNSPIKYMVLQVHYSDVSKFRDGTTDSSGVLINYTEKPMNKLAGVLLLGTAGIIPPMKTEHMETACEIKEHKTMYPIAYRTHTHSLGKVVSGYVVREDEKGVSRWTLLGKRNPLTPQMFYPVKNTDPIMFGDYVAARCTMKSTRKRITEVGATSNDEMCNFYLMYYVENDEPLSMKYCFSQGPPNYYWSDPESGVNNIPRDASTLENTDTDISTD